MAIFKKEKKAEDSFVSTKEATKVGAASAQPVSSSRASGSTHLDRMLTRPRITEKASVLSRRHVYVFEVPKDANKTLIAATVKEIYRVTPVKVNIVNTPAKERTSRGIKGKKSAVKKALVYLKKGDTIEII